MIRLVTAALLVGGLAAPAYALTVPPQCGDDPRIRCPAYDELKVWRIWTTPGGLIDIQFAADEAIISNGDVASPDTVRIIPRATANHLYVKFTRCVQPVPFFVTTVKGGGDERRTYRFQVETHPMSKADRGGEIVCQDPDKMPDQDEPLPRTVKVASTEQNPDLPDQAKPKEKPLPGPGNMHLRDDALDVHGDVMYAVKFSYPSDVAIKRRNESRTERAAREQAQLKAALQAETDFRLKDPWSGDRHYRYIMSGDATLYPQWIWDNGYSTLLLFTPAQQIGTIYEVETKGEVCTKDEHRVEKIAPDSADGHGKHVIAGTARQWVIRKSATEALDICNLDYSPFGSTPDTGTSSPNVKLQLRAVER